MTLRSLRLRLLLGAGAFIIIAVAIATVGLAWLFKRHVENWVDEELRASLDEVIASIERAPDGTITVTTPPPDPRYSHPLSGHYWQVVIEPDGPVLRSRSLWDGELKLPGEDEIDDEVHHHLVPGPAGQELYLLQRRVELPARLGGRTARVAVAVDDAEVDSAVWRFATALAPSLFVLGALLAAASLMQVAYGLRPLAVMRGRLAGIGRGEEDRLGAGFPEEVQPLASEIDTLLDARDRQIAAARARASDLAHGLKTPLQALVGDAQRLRGKGETEAAREIEEIAAGMQRHVERHLVRARIGGAHGSEVADVGRVAVQVVRVVERTPQGSALAWDLDLPENLRARIDVEDLAEALGNLIENAVHHARTRISVSAAHDATDVRITVTDDGPGIPEAQLQEALRRGGRLDTVGSGAGLGLAIVADIAEAWRARLDFVRQDGGFSVRLSVPRAAAEPTPATARTERPRS